MTRIRENHGGHSAANRPAAGPASPQQPGAHHLARPRGHPVDAAPEGLRGLGRAPGVAGDTPSGPSGSGRRVPLRTAPAGLLGLPENIHESIAATMDPSSRAMLACSHPDLRASLRRTSFSDGAVVRSRTVTSLEDLRAVLQDLRSEPLDRPDLQARPLAVLAARIGALQDAVDDRVPAFAAVLETIMQVPAGRRGPMGVALMMLAAQVVTLALAEQPGALRRLLQAQEPPGSMAEGLHLLAGRMEDLPQAAGPLACTQVLHWAGQLEPGPAGELVDRLECLPPAARAPAFFGLLQACGSLEPGLRTERLKALADLSGWLSEPNRLQAIREVLAMAGSLAPEQRWAVLKPLGQVIYRLPGAEHASIWQAVVRSCLAVPSEHLAAALAQVYDQFSTLWNAGEMRQLAVPLMPAILQESMAWLQGDRDLAPAVRNAMLQTGAQGLAELPPAERGAFFGLALGSIPLLLQEHRRPLLNELALVIATLPQEDRPPRWQATLQAVEQLPAGERANLFEPLAAQIGALPMPARAAAFEGLLQAHRRLPAQHRVLSMLALGTGCPALPHAEWPRMLGRVLDEPAGVPSLPHWEPGLMSLAIKFCRAEPAAHGPIDPAPPDGPRLDVRVRCLDKLLALMPLPPHAPGIFLDGVNFLNTELAWRLQQQPDDAAVLAELLERLRRLRGA